MTIGQYLMIATAVLAFYVLCIGLAIQTAADKIAHAIKELKEKP